MMKQARELEDADNKRIVEEWVRNLRRTLFSLADEDAGIGCGRSLGHAQADREDAHRQQMGGAETKATGAGLSAQLVRALDADIVDFELGGVEQSMASSVPHSDALSMHSSSAPPPILCAMARSTDMQVLAEAAKWLRNEKEAFKAATGTQIAEEGAAARKVEAQLTNDETGDAASSEGNERTRKRGVRERDAGKEKEKDAEKDSDRTSKRGRSRASSASNKSKTVNDKADKNKAAPEEERSVQGEAVKGGRRRKEEGGGAEKDDAVQRTQKRARRVWGGENVSQHIALCLLHRKAVQRSVPTLCQTLLDCFDTSAAGTSVEDGAAEVMDVENQPAAQKASKESRNEKGADKDEELKESREASDEEAAREKLRLLEEKLGGLHQQLSAQSERTNKQHSLVRRLQEKQDLDVARARQQGSRIYPYLSSREGDAANMLASSEHALALLSSLNEYVDPAILGLRLRMAKNLCHTANEARVLVAMLLSEQARLRVDLNHLRDRASAALTSKVATSKLESGHDGKASAHLAQPRADDSSKAQLTSGMNTDPAVPQADAPAAAGEAPQQEQLQSPEAPTVTTNPQAESAADQQASAGAEGGYKQADASRQLQQVETALDCNAGLISEMKTAGVARGHASSGMCHLLSTVLPLYSDSSALVCPSLGVCKGGDGRAVCSLRPSLVQI